MLQDLAFFLPLCLDEQHLFHNVALKAGAIGDLSQTGFSDRPLAKFLQPNRHKASLAGHKLEALPHRRPPSTLVHGFVVSETPITTSSTLGNGLRGLRPSDDLDDRREFNRRRRYIQYAGFLHKCFQDAILSDVVL